MKRSAKAIVTGMMLAFFAVPGFAWDMPSELVPVGEVRGITIGSGIVITELGEKDGRAPAREAGLLPGDRLIELGGVKLTKAKDLVGAVTGSDGALDAVFERGGEEMTATIQPYRSDGECYIGVWVRDGVSGIGTVTFYDPVSGVFGALGHPVSEEDAGDKGELKDCLITGVMRGKAGEPGELTGEVGDELLGVITVNSPVGIFGTMSLPDAGEAVPVAVDGEVRTGKAEIIASPDGVARRYAVEITRVYPDGDSARSMMIRVTDPALISLTGGIVQGCSGSPIIQDGRLVGAVTHVLISDPTRGYAVSIRRMLEECAERGIFDTAA